jgi:glucose/arabinose dehydrogenase
LKRLCEAALLVLAALACLPAEARAATLPPGFQDRVVFSGLDQPTVVRFASDGRVFVAEKGGRILVYDSTLDPTPTLFADLSKQVYSGSDRGLLGLALDPAFPAKPYVYALYTFDAPIGGSAPTWGDTCPTPTDGCVVSSRLVRLKASGDTALGRQKVLINDWCQQFLTHTTGALQFGPDGALYVSAGDGSKGSFDAGGFGNPPNPCGDPVSEGGALRSLDLRTLTDPVGLDGAVLRVDPGTGAGLPGNPLFGSPSANARRIIAEGLRNPFRFAFRPGTSEIWIGDVGFNTWEEIDRIVKPTAAQWADYGWPCYEGRAPQPEYQAANLPLCEQLYADTNANVRGPFFIYPHSGKVVPRDPCPIGSSAISGIAFGQPGSYPAQFSGALFFSDYVRNCIWMMFPGVSGLPDPASRQVFVAGAANPVDLEVAPDGTLFYVDISGSIHQITYSPPAQRQLAGAPAHASRR